jgi:hypothetical protein
MDVPESPGDCSVIDSFAILNGEAGIIGTIVRANIAMNNQSSAFSFAPAAWRLATPPSRNGGFGIGATCPVTHRWQYRLRNEG